VRVRTQLIQAVRESLSKHNSMLARSESGWSDLCVCFFAVVMSKHSEHELDQRTIALARMREKPVTLSDVLTARIRAYAVESGMSEAAMTKFLLSTHPAMLARQNSTASGSAPTQSPSVRADPPAG
jgi:hypothetical protein